MNRLLIASNRLPVTVVKKKERLRFNPSVGGLATALSSFYQSHNGEWVGWCGMSSNKLSPQQKGTITTKLKKDYTCHAVFLSDKEIRDYYNGFCNKTIWPLFHYFSHHAVFEKSFWQAYKQVNESFCNAIAEITGPKDTIWIHDYHLMLLPQMLREKLPHAKIGFFLHIPFPSLEIFRLLPWRKELLKGILGADLVGFHTHDYVKHFLESMRFLVGYEYAYGRVMTKNRLVKVDSFPLGIEFDRFANAAKEEGMQEKIEKMRKKIGTKKFIISVDRLDYSKGIVPRLLAFDYFLEQHPKFKKKVSLIHVAVPSRTKVKTYIQLKHEIDELIGRINGKYGTIDWTPVRYMYRFLPFSELVALYYLADVALVTPVRDGMNLIAKEYLAAKTDSRGVLILSEMAGAAKELAEAIIVNPLNTVQVGEAICKALTMPDAEKISANIIMRERLSRYTVERWAEDFVDKLDQIKRHQQKMRTKIVTTVVRQQMMNQYNKSSKRLLLLDYDGTLIPFAQTPTKAIPDAKLKSLLDALSRNAKNCVVVISGRDKETLQKWLGDLNIGLVAEHGAWIRENKGAWELIEPLTNDWKDEVRPLLNAHVDKTPGSLLEEKDFSLVWHYRRTDPELAAIRINELKETIGNVTANLNLAILEGNKVIEIKNPSINKGRAALHWISKINPDFILSTGDDWTDEDIFAIVPSTAYTIKVGLGASRAQYCVASFVDVRLILEELLGENYAKRP